MRVDAGCSTCSVGEGESTSSAIICFSYWSMFSLRYRILFLAILFSLSSLLHIWSIVRHQHSNTGSSTRSYLGEGNIIPLPRALTLLAKSLGVPSLQYVVSPVPEGTPVRIRRSELTGRTADAHTHPLSANPSPGECLGM